MRTILNTFILLVCIPSLICLCTLYSKAVFHLDELRFGNDALSRVPPPRGNPLVWRTVVHSGAGSAAVPWEEETVVATAEHGSTTGETRTLSFDLTSQKTQDNLHAVEHRQLIDVSGQETIGLVGSNTDVVQEGQDASQKSEREDIEYDIILDSLSVAETKDEQSTKSQNESVEVSQSADADSSSASVTEETVTSSSASDEDQSTTPELLELLEATPPVQLDSITSELTLIQEDMGVSQLLLPLYLTPGTLLADDFPEDQAVAALRLWVKFLVSADLRTVHVRGMFVFEPTPAALNLTSRAALATPLDFFEQFEHLALHPFEDDEPLEEIPHQEQPQYVSGLMSRPWWFNATMTTVHSSFLFNISGAVVEGEALLQPVYSQAVPEETEPICHFVIAPSDVISTDHQAQLLHHHIHYHQKLEFDGWMYYVDKALLDSLLYTSELAPYIDDGTVLLLHWLPLYDSIVHKYYSARTLVYNHAILAYTGKNTWLALADLDDYLATTFIMTDIFHTLETCVGEEEFAVASISRQEYTCSDCKSNLPAGAHWILAPESDPATAKHPLQRYNLRTSHRAGQPDDEDGASLVWPDYVYGWLVNDGYVIPDPPTEDGGAGSALEVSVNSSCAFWVHLSTEVLPKNIAVVLPEDIYWHWIFDTL